MMDLIVFISEIPSQPPITAAMPGSRISVTLGESLTKTGTFENSFAQEVISCRTLGSSPTALPIPRSHMP